MQKKFAVCQLENRQIEGRDRFIYLNPVQGPLQKGRWTSINAQLREASKLESVNEEHPEETVKLLKSKSRFQGL